MSEAMDINDLSLIAGAALPVGKVARESCAGVQGMIQDLNDVCSM